MNKLSGDIIFDTTEFVTFLMKSQLLMKIVSASVPTLRRIFLNECIFDVKRKTMEVITFESEVYRDLVSKIESIAEYISKQEMPTKSSGEIWMDTLDVCQLLNISSRTLQRLRNDKFIPFTMLRG